MTHIAAYVAGLLTPFALVALLALYLRHKLDLRW